MTPLVLAPIALQAAAMFVDEAHYHRRRGLPRWERIGHPLDTATVLACFALALASPPTPTALRAYLALAIFSCLFVMKDEPVHARRCSRGENALHAALFVLHPIVLGVVAFLWRAGARPMIAAQAAITLAFGVYQTLYWNVFRSRRCSERRFAR